MKKTQVDYKENNPYDLNSIPKFFYISNKDLIPSNINGDPYSLSGSYISKFSESGEKTFFTNMIQKKFDNTLG